MYDSAARDLEILTELRDAYRRIEDLNKRVIELEKFRKHILIGQVEQLYLLAKFKQESGDALSDDEKFVLKDKESILNRI